MTADATLALFLHHPSSRQKMSHVTFITCISDNIVTIFLSFDCKHNILLSRVHLHLVPPRSFSRPVPPFSETGNPFLFSAIVPDDGVPFSKILLTKVTEV